MSLSRYGRPSYSFTHTELIYPIDTLGATCTDSPAGCIVLSLYRFLVEVVTFLELVRTLRAYISTLTNGRFFVT
jgi:hypothetical protein